MSRSTLVVFDFDHTIVDDNTDTVVRKLVPKSSLVSAEEVYKKTNSWTLYMREIFKCLHGMNVSKEKILSAIHLIPPITGMDKLLRMLDNRNYEVIIISDSNSVFIDEWLNSYNLSKVFRKVITNPAWFDDSELLNIEFYQHQTFCDLSEPNLCKGHAMETYISERKNDNKDFDSVVFIGDGNNDFCPALKLKEGDFVFPRINYSLFKKILDNKDNIKAKIFPWSDGDDIIDVFKEEIEKRKCT